METPRPRTSMNGSFVLGLGTLLLLGLPLLGIAMAGKPVAMYVEFPPRTATVEHAEFSWPVFLGFSGLILGALAPFAFRLTRGPSSPAERPVAGSTASHRPFPWWGWGALGWTAGIWFLAWTRFEWMAPYQSLTFTPLWIGYILVVNALAWRRGGTSLLVERPGAFAALFPASAVLWWVFEYLNRFVQNWSYHGVDDLTPWTYFLQATLPFSTVLPAVVGTQHLLITVPRLSSGLDQGPAVTISQPRRFAGTLLLLAGAGLLGLGVWPNVLFPLVWMAPLVILAALQGLAGQPTVFDSLGQGDWRRIWTAAVAALVCGAFWELWNWRSLAHWTYAIPYVDRYHLFAMPLLGYAGYLPFGLECLVVADMIVGARWTVHPIVARRSAW